MAVLVTTYCYIYTNGCCWCHRSVQVIHLGSYARNKFEKHSVMIVSRCSNHHNSPCIKRHFANSIFGLAGVVFTATNHSLYMCYTCSIVYDHNDNLFFQDLNCYNGKKFDYSSTPQFKNFITFSVCSTPAVTVIVLALLSTVAFCILTLSLFCIQ